jgi:hypothetical protein
MTVEFYEIKNLRRGQYTHLETIELNQTWVDSNRFKNLYWLNEQIIGFLNVDNILFLVLGKDKLPTKLPGAEQKKDSTDRLFCMQENDGLRVISINFQKSTGSNNLYRIESEEELNIQSISSTHIACRLVNWYKSEKILVQKNIVQEEELWKNQDNLIKGIETMQHALEYKLDKLEMKKLIKVINYVKRFVSEEEDERRIGESMKILLLKIKIWNTLRSKKNQGISFIQFQNLINCTKDKGTKLMELCCHIHEYQLAKLVVDLICTDKQDIIFVFRTWSENLMQAQGWKDAKDKFSYENQVNLSKKIYTLFKHIYSVNKKLPKTEFIVLAEKCSKTEFNVLAEELMTINNPPRLKIRRYFQMKLPILALRETVDFPDSNYVYILLGELYLKYKDKGLKTVEKKIATLESSMIWNHWDYFATEILNKKIDYEDRLLLSDGKSDVNNLISNQIQKLLQNNENDQINSLRKIITQIQRVLNLRNDQLITNHFHLRLLPFYQFLIRFGLTDLRYFLKHQKHKMETISVSNVVAFYAESGPRKFESFENMTQLVIAESAKIKMDKVKYLVKKGLFEDAFDYIVVNKIVQVSYMGGL